MGKVYGRLILAFFIFTSITGCADDSDYLANVKQEIGMSDYEIAFAGNVRSDCVFKHKEHSDREEGICFTCHNCEDIQGETHWYCRSCHSAENTEGLCTSDGIHGCTYAQCLFCHEEIGRNKGLDCSDCHP